MKDRQIELDGGEPRIPFVSAALHCVAMTGIVFFRYGFGFIYLRPKSVFFAFSWAFVLFVIAAWNEPEMWGAYRIPCIFGLAAMTLYWVHLAVAVSQQWQQKAAHDRYSGTSIMFRFLKGVRAESPAELERQIHLWFEPGLVLLGAATLRFAFGERHLSNWLFLLSGCFWCKEGLNRWFEIRQVKRQKDIFDDATDTPDAPTSTILDTETPKATRKEGVKQPRNKAAAEEKAKERRFAEALRLKPPYSIEKAEENYLTLIKLEHPDATTQSPESNARAAELNEAIEFFRERLKR